MECDYKFLGASVRGVSHVKSGLPNQDSIAIKEYAKNITRPQNDNESCSFYSKSSYQFDNSIKLSVSDGHGSAKCFRSDRGSQIAVSVLNRLLDDLHYESYLGVPGGLSVLKKELEKSLPVKLANKWQEKVIDDFFYKKPSEEEISLLKTRLNGTEFKKLSELLLKNNKKEISNSDKQQILTIYGATVLGILITKDFTFLIQLGDGDILAVYEKENELEVIRPIAKDPNLIANETTSLCETNAAENVRTAFMVNEKNPPVMVMLSTDGYSNAFSSEEGFCKVASDIWSMLKSGKEEEIKLEIINWLNSASKYSGDDVTVGLVYQKI